MPRLGALGAVCVVGVALQPLAAAGQTDALSSALLDRYCVTCHNERLKTAD